MIDSLGQLGADTAAAYRADHEVASRPNPQPECPWDRVGHPRHATGVMLRPRAEEIEVNIGANMGKSSLESQQAPRSGHEPILPTNPISTIPALGLVAWGRGDREKG